MLLQPQISDTTSSYATVPTNTQQSHPSLARVVNVNGYLANTSQGILWLATSRRNRNYPQSECQLLAYSSPFPTTPEASYGKQKQHSLAVHKYSNTKMNTLPRTTKIFKEKQHNEREALYNSRNYNYGSQLRCPQKLISYGQTY